jgi:hypothetical protein
VSFLSLDTLFGITLIWLLDKNKYSKFFKLLILFGISFIWLWLNEIDFILVSKEHYVNLKREMLSKISYGFYESADILKRPTMKIKQSNLFFKTIKVSLSRG